MMGGKSAPSIPLCSLPPACACVRACMHGCVRACMHGCVCAGMCARTLACVHLCVCVCVRARACVQACVRPERCSSHSSSRSSVLDTRGTATAPPPRPSHPFKNNFFQPLSSKKQISLNKHCCLCKKTQMSVMKPCLKIKCP